MTHSDDMALLVKATAFAAEKHRHQRRKDTHASPYINHPIALANVLTNEAGISDVEVLCAAILHDTIEDTDTTAQELEQVFGQKIADIVGEVTDDKSLPKDVRKQLQIEHASHSSHQAKLVKLADKICNLRDLLDSPPTDWPQDRQDAYFDWAKRVVAGLRGTNAKLEELFDEIIKRHEMQS